MPPLDGIADPTALYRLREGVYAPDLLIAAVAEFDLFSCIAAHGVLRASAPAGDEASAQP